jgi:hypothetical protein
MQHRNGFVREPRLNTKINDCDIKDKPWCTLGPSCGPRAGVLLHPLTSIHPAAVIKTIKSLKTGKAPGLNIICEVEVDLTLTADI